MPRLPPGRFLFLLPYQTGSNLEMHQSVRIMRQCLEKLRLTEGQGPMTIKNNKIIPPLRAEMSSRWRRQSTISSSIPRATT
jgi:NADH:ubiquinone oxidoreductase subunit D